MTFWLWGLHGFCIFTLVVSIVVYGNAKYVTLAATAMWMCAAALFAIAAVLS